MFEYRCLSCQMIFEKYSAGGDAGPGEDLSCPRCGNTGVEKVFSAFCSPGGETAGAASGSGCGSGGFS